jgi:hypothetical protein
MKLKLITILIIACTLFSICTSANKSIDINLKSNNEITITSYESWNQINEDGFGDPSNVAPRGVEIFNNTLISGTANYKINEGSLFFEKPLRLSKFLFDVYSGNKYNYENMESNGCEIWSYNGSSMNQLIGKNGILPSGFGNVNNLEVGVLIEFKGYLYAGIRNTKEGCQVWRTKDINKTWEQVASNGFGNDNNIWCMEAEKFDEYLYMGTMNWDGFELFRTTDGVTWEAVIGGTSNTKAGFGTTDVYVWSMEVYDNTLYLGSHRGQIWRSKDGVSWEPLLAYDNILQARLNGAHYPAAFKRIFYRAGGIRNMLAYNNELYIFTAGGFSIDFKIPCLGLLFRYSTDSIISRLLYRTAFLGAEIWKYNSSSDKWTRLIGKKGTETTNRGFGDSKNIYFWSVEIHDNSLYLGTGHIEPISLVMSREGLFHWTVTLKTAKGHGELWKYDGDVWEKIVGQDANFGFNDEYNFGIRELKSFKNNLYLHTFNLKTGCEVWELN